MTPPIKAALVSLTSLVVLSTFAAAGDAFSITRDSEKMAYRILYAVAPEMRHERLALVNDIGCEGQGTSHCVFQADFRYLADPEARTRLLALRMTVPSDGSAKKVSLAFCHARHYFQPFKQGGGQDRWAIIDRVPLALHSTPVAEKMSHPW